MNFSESFLISLLNMTIVFVLLGFLYILVRLLTNLTKYLETKVNK